ncbi:aminoacyl-tRNA hydrolase [Candidatus Saccharibacteria bacterium]|nr:aminoacyl-tRNA hydrolase [Candidatus Saccharibacteria bacterium]
MKLLIFLGNPGLGYRKTRHNIGFMVGDYLADKWNVKWKFDKKLSAEIARHDDVLLTKPQLFYNLTGQSVAKIMQFYKIPPENLLVICDDINLPFGTHRLREKGSDGGNNGLKSISAILGENYIRLRIGTDNDLRAQIGDIDFVLSKFSKDERAQLSKVLTEAADKIADFITRPIDK